MLSARLAARSVGDVILAPTTIHQHPLHGAVLRRHLGCARRLLGSIFHRPTRAGTDRCRKIGFSWSRVVANLPPGEVVNMGAGPGPRTLA